MEHETFWSLLANPAHWEFELFLMAVFDGLIGLLVWPSVKKAIKHYKSCERPTVLEDVKSDSSKSVAA